MKHGSDETGSSEGGTRREILQDVLMLSAAAVALPFATDAAGAAVLQGSGAAAPQTDAGKSLYDRLGGIFAIAAVVDYFSDELIKDPVAGAGSANPQLREWSTKDLGRLPGLKFMRTLWVAKVSGGPFEYTPTRPGSTNLGLENAHKNLKISPAEFDAAAAVLSRSLDHFSVPAREKAEVLGAFAAHKNEVTEGWRDAQQKAS